ncbi:MAG: hypothetical protein ABI886_17355 [Betaproteobacteria bacterium]
MKLATALGIALIGMAASISALAQTATAQLIVTEPASLAGGYAAVTYDVAPSRVTSSTPIPQGDVFVYDGVNCATHTLTQPMPGTGAGKVALLTGSYPASCPYYDDVVRELQADGVVAVIFGFSGGTWRASLLHGNPAGISVPVLYMQVDEVSARIRSSVIAGNKVSVSFMAVPGMVMLSTVDWFVAGETRVQGYIPNGSKPSTDATWDLSTFDFDRTTAGVQQSYQFPTTTCGGTRFDFDTTKSWATVSVPAGSTYTGSCSKTWLIRDSKGYQGVGIAFQYIGVPYLHNDSAQTAPGVPVTIDVLANDVGNPSTKVPERIDLVPSTAAIDQSVSTLEGSWGVANGKVVFAPAPGFADLATIRYTVAGGNGGASNTATITVTVGMAQVVEYYWATRDHYFISSNPAEIAALDAAPPGGWGRTGKTFKTLPTAQAGTSPVCRFYVPPQFGDSHFYGRGTAECEGTHARHPEFVYESPAVMYMYLPALGVCGSGTVPVYRAFDNRGDVNHRYTTDRGVRDQMVALGWLAEGDGPDLVVMCAPQ